MNESGKNDAPDRANVRSREVISAAIEVHRALGPGFLESVYEESLCMELYDRGIPFVRQRDVIIRYKGRDVGSGRTDLIVDDVLIVELKAVDALAPIHKAQLLSYLRTTGHPLGLLINFNVTTLKDGVQRVILSPSTLS
jgi:GxxExxY protein